MHDRQAGLNGVSFVLISGGLLFSNILLLCFIGVIETFHFQYGQLPGNPPVTLFFLLGASCCYLLSVMVLRLMERKRRDDGYEYGCMGWSFYIGAAIFFGWLFTLGIAALLPLIMPTEAVMTRSNFVYQNIFITQGYSVRFTNPREGRIQVLCVGTHERCTSTTEIPDELRSPGRRLLPGYTLMIQFLSPGTYPVISLSTPGMSVTIHVIKNEPSTGP